MKKKELNAFLRSRWAKKLLLTMKLTIVLLLVGLMQVSATVYSQATKFNFKLEDRQVVEVLKEIEENSKFRFFYLREQVDVERRVSVNASGASVEEILDELFRGEDVGYEVMEDFLILISPNEKLKTLAKTVGQQRIISGKVTNEQGEPLPGVTVLIKGTTNGTVTNFEGVYSISNVPEGSILQFSFVGMKAQEVEVGNQSSLDIVLMADAIGIEEVVAIGYGVAKKSDLTGAVTSVKSEDIETTPANTIVQSLQGRAAGVDIKAASNAPGGGIRIRIRGTNSINASSEPLYVIDGFPVENLDSRPRGAGQQASSPSPLSTLSPNDIASVEILKDASATAIYGARGANGVVLITTKRGKVGKAKINFDYSAKISSVRKTLDLANAQELAVLNNEWAVNNNRPLIYDGINRPLPEELGEGTDWQDVVFRTAVTHNYNLSVSGGTENTQYNISGSYLDEDGIIIESNFKRAGLKINLDQKFSNRLKLGVNVNANYSINDAVPSDGGGFQNDTPLWNALAQTPVNSVYDEEGNYLHNHDETVKVLENPVSIAKTRTDLTNTTRLLNSAYLDYEILSGLVFRANFGAEIIDSKRNVYIPNTAETQAMPNKGVASIGTVQNINLLSEYTLTYKKEFNNEQRLNLMIGYTAQTNDYESVYSQTNDFFTNVVEYNNLGMGADPRPSGSGATETGLISYIGRLNYAYKDKYILTGTIRRDGSSKFGEDNKWGMFPSGGFAWRVSEEEFMNKLGFISDLKLRSSYGITGNQNIGSYNSIATYGTTKPIIGGNPVVGLVPSKIPNPDLKWERTKQFNVGTDAVLFDGKVNFSAEYYIKKTDDLLLNVTIPVQSGFGGSVQNIGKVENKGFEFSLGYNNQLGKVNWSSNFNISFNRNKVLSLVEGTERLLYGIGRGETGFGQSIVIPGQPLGMFYGYRFEGIWQTEEEILSTNTPVGGINRPGLVRYADLNGDGFRRNDDDKEIIGDPNPDFIFGFSNDFNYKNWTLSVFINGSYGNDIANMNLIGLLAQPQKHNVLKRVYNERWTGVGSSNTIETPLTNAGEWKNFSTRELEDGSYLRVKTISLTYDLPQKYIRNSWIRKASFQLSADNLITITNYTGYDPEVDLYSSSNVALGVDNGAYPSAKSIRAGVKLTF